MTMWKPGMRCVCVNADLPPVSFGKHNGDMGGLTLGRVYTVADVISDHGSICLILAEIEREGGEVGFFAHRFRPLSETRLDQFRQHLTPKPKVEEKV